MSAASRYVLDANVFIQAHQTYYGRDICPGFWLALLRQHEARRIFSMSPMHAIRLRNQARGCGTVHLLGDVLAAAVAA